MKPITLASVKPKISHIEDQECRYLWQWAQHVPELMAYLYHSPNGGKRIQKKNKNGVSYSPEAVRLKRVGVRAGVSDYHLPVARGHYIGLWIEMKAAKPQKSAVSTEQRVWMEKMVFQRHAVFVCYGWMQAKRVFEWYLKLPVPDLIAPPLPAIEDLL